MSKPQAQKGGLTRMFVRARHIDKWAMYDAGLVDETPETLDEALAMIPADQFQAIDAFYLVPEDESKAITAMPLPLGSADE